MIRADIFASLLCAVTAAGVCVRSAAADLDAGEAIYDVCAGCHGFQAQGNASVSAPGLTTLESWYLSRQLRDFGRGVRGAAAGDTHGRRMAPFALLVTDDRALENVVAYIGSLPPEPVPSTIAGDPARGQALFAVCTACHGMRGEGNEQLSSPRLAGLDDWYIVNQLVLFREGLRGANPGDTYGQQMRPMATQLADQQAVNDVAAYVATLASGESQQRE